MRLFEVKLVFHEPALGMFHRLLPLPLAFSLFTLFCEPSILSLHGLDLRTHAPEDGSERPGRPGGRGQMGPDPDGN